MPDMAEPENALAELLAIGGVEAVPTAFEGADPVFPTPYKVGTAGAAVLAAVGSAAARLWSLKTGRNQTVRIAVRAAAAAMRSARYLRIDGKPPPEAWDPLSGFYPVKDGRWLS